MRRLCSTLLLTIVASAWGAAPASPASPTDREAFGELQVLAARRPEYTDEVGKRVSELIMRLWEHPDYRYRVATVINLGGGWLDRIWNRWTLAHEGGAKDLPSLATVDEKLVRGGQPTEAGFRRLKELGVGTVVNLRYEEPSEESVVKSLGMRYVYLPVQDTDCPTQAQIREFLSLIERPDTGKVYVHCAWGVNRTGTMVALWRIQRGMKPRKALAEAVSFGLDERRLRADRP
ncbi:MAG: dual specificity protein phosphatase family protein, partial [Candidatus Riflebacteria bacterium]|nr:dual specificity protein phosphatase family protein [Candidatus Riflebacteria bacterium]